MSEPIAAARLTLPGVHDIYVQVERTGEMGIIRAQCVLCGRSIAPQLAEDGALVIEHVCPLRYPTDAR